MRHLVPRGRRVTGEGAGLVRVAEIEVDGAERLVVRSDRWAFAAAWPGDVARSSSPRPPLSPVALTSSAASRRPPSRRDGHPRPWGIEAVAAG